MNSHIGLIASYSMRFAMRTGGGVVFILILLSVGFGLAYIFVSPVESLMKSSDFDPVEVYKSISTSDSVTGAIGWVTGTTDDQTAYWVKEKPALLSVILLSLLIFIPYTTCLGAFNQTSGDIGNRGFRFLLLRTERSNIFFGRFLGAMMFTIISCVFTVAILALYLTFKIKIYSGLEIWTWSFHGLLAILVLSLPYAALCAWFSAMLDSAFGALAICLTVVGLSVLLLGLLQFLLSTQFDLNSGQLSWMQRITPWGWKYELLSGDYGVRSVAYLAMFGFTALFLWLGLRTFEKRDL